jgi:TRAP-type C4-dicarboxylate transport system substrate-binding protein
MDEDIDTMSWEDIARLVEKKIRREAARAVDAGEDNWEKIGKGVESKLKREFAKVVEAKEGASWEEIGKGIEKKVKKAARDWSEK